LKNKASCSATGLLILVLIGLAACSAQQTKATVVPEATNLSIPVAVQSPTDQTFADPFAYCADIGAIDRPDARYIGPKITDEVVNGYLKAAGIEPNSEYSDVYKQMTIWRCMGRKVYACNFGANLPCDSKANTDKTPTQAMADFCKESPNADFIPMSVTGHETIFSWRCVKDLPELIEQIAQVDAAGYLANIWYAIEP
jgi:hypothetical protein